MTTFWAWRVYKNRPVILGKFDTEQEAVTEGFRKLGGEFEVHESQYLDRNKVRDEIKAKILNTSNNLDSILQRARYKVTKEEISE